MIQLLLPAFVAGLIGAAYLAQQKRQQGEMTPERTSVFETAINSVQDPVKLRELANAFEKQGLPAQAEALRKRADGRELPPDVKAGRRDAFKKAMASQDPRAVLRMADVFESEGAIGAARELRRYALELKNSEGTATPPIVPPTAPVDATGSPEAAALGNLATSPEMAALASLVPDAAKQ